MYNNLRPKFASFAETRY